MLRKSSCWDSIWKLHFYIFTFPSERKFHLFKFWLFLKRAFDCLGGSSYWRWGPHPIFCPRIARPWPGAWITLPSSLLCTWCRKPWALRLLLEFGLLDSWLQGRESGSLWAHSRLSDKKWASVWYFGFAEVENQGKSCFLWKFTCWP